MKICTHISILLLLACHTLNAEESEYMSVEEMLKSGKQWISENVSQELVSRAESTDPETVRQFWRQLQTRFQGEHIIDLAPLKNNARLILAFLEQVKDAQPYAVWLNTRMDYFEVANELRFTIPPPRPSQPRNRTAPSAATQRNVWRKQIENEPLSVGAKHYATKLKPIFVSVGISPELIWLAEVESSFNPSARSPSGAAGMFQFMPATARQYGMSTSPVDERLQPEKSARAAARYLKYLHKRFGTWPLALAAYNAGEGKVSRTLKKHNGKSFADIASFLPAETQLYVPKIEAILMKREGVELQDI